MPFFEYKELNSPQPPTGSPISVIAAFNCDGAIKPLRIRINEPDGYIEANIDKVVNEQQMYGTQHVFRCIITINNIQHNLKLIYDSISNKWRIGQ